MNNLLILFAGEIQRMKKYNILGASFLVSLIWIGVLHFTEINNVSGIFPLLLYVDATSMSMMMVGVTMFFEKQEGVFKTLMVSPISKTEYILAKTFANILSNVITLVVLYVYAILFKEIDINFVALLGGVILIAFFHSLIGFLLTYYSKDFTELLTGIMKYAIVLVVPVLLDQLGLIKGELISKLLYLIPTKASSTILNSAVGGVETWEVFISLGYLIGGSVLLYFVVLKKFDEFAIKESGV